MVERVNRKAREFDTTALLELNYARSKIMATPSIQTELRDFVQFASERVTRREVCSSLEELVQQWRSESEFTAAVADVRHGMEADAAGEAKPVDEAFAEVRNELGINP